VSAVLFGAAVAAALIWVRGTLRLPAAVDDSEPPPIRCLFDDDVLVTPQGVEIPVAWIANDADLDEVLATLQEIDSMGAVA
jgi:hypothetical protein